MFDAQMLLDPFEEQFHLPAQLVERADRGGRKVEGIGQKDQRLAVLGILEANAPQVLGIVSLRVEAIQGDTLVAHDPVGLVASVGIDPMRRQIRLGAGDKEGPSLMQRIEAGEIDIAPIHDVEGTRLRYQQIECVDVRHLAVGDVNEGRDGAAQIQQGVQLDRTLGGSEARPRKQRQAQVDGRGIQRIDRVGQFHAERLVHIERPRLGDQALPKLGIHAPVAQLVGVRQRRACHRGANAHMVEPVSVGRETGFDVAQTLPPGELGKSHDAQLIRARQRAHPQVRLIAADDAMKGLPRQKVHDLSKQCLAVVHRNPRSQNRKFAVKSGTRAMFSNGASNMAHSVVTSKLTGQ